MVAQSPCRSIRGIARKLGVEYHALYLILQDEDTVIITMIIVSNTASGFYGNMNVIRSFWSASYGRTFTRDCVFNSHNRQLRAQHNSRVTHEWTINFAGALMCGPVSLAIVWLGHTCYPTASVASLIVCSCRKFYWCCLKMCHWRFDVTCGFNTMGRRRILVHRLNSTSRHSLLTGG
jgi:hypothetical protein